MNKVILVLALLLVPALPASATFSIVAIDPVTGDLGIAVFTGDAAQAWRGHAKGKTWSAQGNILVGPQ